MRSIYRPFYQNELANRISLRHKIFREVVANILIHCEYSNLYPAKFIIERNQVVSENSNRPTFHGVINPNDFAPFPKNPILSAFFREIGRSEELGSGVRNLFKYTQAYSRGMLPKLIEEDVFKIIIPLDERLFMDDVQEVNGEYSVQDIKTSGKIIEAVRLNPNITIPEMADLIGVTTRSIERNIESLKKSNQLKRVGSAKDCYWEVIAD